MAAIPVPAAVLVAPTSGKGLRVSRYVVAGLVIVLAAVAVALWQRALIKGWLCWMAGCQMHMDSTPLLSDTYDPLW